jgi:menaquinone-dependent protoporphyrinogen oxidase
MAVLVAYASAFGSTREIAERIAARMGRAMVDVECRQVDDIEAASGYNAVILGSAIHNQEWLPAAMSFVRRAAPQVGDTPVWAFSVGMADGLPKLLRHRAKALQEQRLAEALQSEMPLRDHELFSGVYQASQMPPLLRGLFRLTGGKFGDLRDWEAVDAWADQIIAQLPTPPSPDSPAKPNG